jgi:hypothetical protein
MAEDRIPEMLPAVEARGVDDEAQQGCLVTRTILADRSWMVPVA